VLLPAIRYSEGRGIWFTVCLFVCLFVNDFSTTHGPIHAKVRMLAYPGAGCVFSPFGGWRPSAGGKRGKWNRDRPKPILLVSAVAETVAETEDTHSAVAEPGAESLVLVSAETVAETET